MIAVSGRKTALSAAHGAKTAIMVIGRAWLHAAPEATLDVSHTREPEVVGINEAEAASRASPARSPS